MLIFITLDKILKGISGVQNANQKVTKQMVHKLHGQNTL